MLTISAKTIGQRKPLFADFSVPLPDELAQASEVPFQELLKCVVRHEVQAFQERQSRRQFLRVLSEREIAAGESRGKIESGDPQTGQFSSGSPKHLDPEEAFETVRLGFEDRLFLVIIDEVEIQDLQEIVSLQPNSQLTFIRLTMLAGG